MGNLCIGLHNNNIQYKVDVLGIGKIRKRGCQNAHRLVKYYDLENDKELEFISNNSDISALQMANIYQNRWQIETFFKWIKGNLTIKAKCGSDYSITEVEMLLRVSVFERMNIRDLLTQKEIKVSDVSNYLDTSFLLHSL